MQLNDALRNATLQGFLDAANAGSTIPRVLFQLMNEDDELLWEIPLNNGGDITEDAGTTTAGEASFNPPYDETNAQNYTSWLDVNAVADTNKIDGNDVTGAQQVKYAQLKLKDNSTVFPKLTVNTQAELTANPTWEADVVISSKTLEVGIYPTFPVVPKFTLPAGSYINV